MRERSRARTRHGLRPAKGLAGGRTGTGGTPRASQREQAARHRHRRAGLYQHSGLTGIPAFEQESWAQQAREAEAWAADNNAETPLLAGIAAARGVPLDLLRQKALSKSRAYTTLTAAVAGQRQALEDAVTACANVAAVEAVKVQFTAPEAA